MAQPAFTKCEQLLLVDRNPRPRDHESHGILAEITVGHAYGCRFQYRWMRFEDLVNLARSNIDAALDDELFGAANDEEITVLVPAGEISGMQPPVSIDDSGSAFGILVISPHQG